MSQVNKFELFNKKFMNYMYIFHAKTVYIVERYFQIFLLHLIEETTHTGKPYPDMSFL